MGISFFWGRPVQRNSHGEEKLTQLEQASMRTKKARVALTGHSALLCYDNRMSQCIGQSSCPRGAERHTHRVKLLEPTKLCRNRALQLIVIQKAAASKQDARFDALVDVVCTKKCMRHLQEDK